MLNRVIRWSSHGIEMEADPRQAEKLVAECGLEGAKTVATPGIRQSFAEAEKDEPLPEHLHTAFRGAAARANYLAADQLDCQFAAKEICRWMAKPSMSSWGGVETPLQVSGGPPEACARLSMAVSRQDRRVHRHGLGRLPTYSQEYKRWLHHAWAAHHQDVGIDSGEHLVELW